jgi:hypothetical protein
MATDTPRRSHADVLLSDTQGVEAPADADKPLATDPELDDETGDEEDQDEPEGDDDRDEEDTMAATPTRKTTHAEVLFGDTVANDLNLNLEDNWTRLADREGLRPDQVAAQRQEFGTAIQELGLERSDAQRLHNLVTEARLGRGTEAWTTKSAKWPEQSRKVFSQRYGAEADQLSSDIDQFIEQQPPLGKIIAGEVAGHPDVRLMARGSSAPPWTTWERDLEAPGGHRPSWPSTLSRYGPACTGDSRRPRTWAHSTT